LRAPVIDILALLDFRCHLAIVVSARQQAPTRKTPCAVFLLIVAMENRLDLLEAVRRNEWSVGAGVQLPLPQELPLIKRTLEQSVQIALDEINSRFLPDWLFVRGKAELASGGTSMNAIPVVSRKG
jgi:hypothetical protein